MGEMKDELIKVEKEEDEKREEIHVEEENGEKMREKELMKGSDFWGGVEEGDKVRGIGGGDGAEGEEGDGGEGVGDWWRKRRRARRRN